MATAAVAASSKHKKQHQHRFTSFFLSSSWYSFSWWIALVIIITAVTVAGFAFLPHRPPSSALGVGSTFDSQDSSQPHNMSEQDSSQQTFPSIRIAHLGNSIQYYNDCPRLLEQMIASSGRAVVQDSCLRGGATWEGLFRNGNGMHSKFGISPNAGTRADGTVDVGAATVVDLFQGPSHHKKNKSFTPPIWDVCVMNDFTQGPARAESRDKSIRALKKSYVPLFVQQQKEHGVTVLPILLQTPAYRRAGVKDTEDLGDFAHFTKLLERGYQAYAQVLAEMRFPARIAAVGNAFAYVRDNVNESFWERLYCDDDYHPSPHGSWLEACVLYATIFQEAPPVYQEVFWSRQRYQLPPEHRPLPNPTAEEAETLRQVAVRVGGLKVEKDDQHHHHHHHHHQSHHDSFL